MSRMRPSLQYSPVALKRARVEDRQPSPFADGDISCSCDYPECPWRWAPAGDGRGGAVAADVEDCGGDGGGEPSFFHGPLLSVKQFRDNATGGTR